MVGKEEACNVNGNREVAAMTLFQIYKIRKLFSDMGVDTQFERNVMNIEYNITPVEHPSNLFKWLKQRCYREVVWAKYVGKKDYWKFNTEFFMNNRYVVYYTPDSEECMWRWVDYYLWKRSKTKELCVIRRFYLILKKCGEFEHFVENILAMNKDMFYNDMEFIHTNTFGFKDARFTTIDVVTRYIKYNAWRIHMDYMFGLALDILKYRKTENGSILIDRVSPRFLKIYDAFKKRHKES